jgi:predicted Zn-dependent peptidase
MIHEISKTHSRIATIIVSFDAGSRVEEPGEYNPGIAHMLEHSLFKGSDKRNSQQIQREIAFLGGHSNAFTSHESVAYYVSVPYENLEPCIDILSDMVFNPVFPEEEVMREVEVVKEEELSSTDDPSHYIWRAFSETFFNNYLALPVLGTQDSISKFTTDELKRFHSEFCKRENAVVSICSNLSKKDSKALLNKYFGPATGRVKSSYEFFDSDYSEERYMEITKGGLEHSYVWMGMPSVNVASEIDAAVQILMTVLGRGMDCRLFEEVREKRGLVYGISSGNTDWQHGGVSLIEFSTREANLPDAIEVVDTQLDLIKLEMPTEEEVQRAKNKIRSSFYSAIEDSYSLAYWAIRRRLQNVPTIEDYMKNIEAVTASDVTDAANVVFDQDRRLLLLCSGESNESD